MAAKSRRHHTLRVLLLAIFILFLIPAMLFLMIIGDSVLNYVAQFLPITVEFISFWTKARFLSMGFALILLTSAVYYLSPSQPPKWRYIFPGGAAFYILLDAVFRIFLVLCRPHGELFRDLRLYRGNHRLPYLAESFADGTASGGSV